MLSEVQELKAILKRQSELYEEKISKIKQENEHLHLANQGIHHYIGCTEDDPCCRCERDGYMRLYREEMAKHGECVAERNRYKQALFDIIRHQELISGTMPAGATVAIARKALEGSC